MQTITTIGLDIAKSVFQVHGVDAGGHVIVRRQLKRRSASARLLREHADQIGLNPAFTIHDREDSADLMNLIRHELGFSSTRWCRGRRGR
jgi:transposase